MGRLMKVLALPTFPDKFYRNALESVDQWEEKLMNEKVMMSGSDFRQLDHQIDQNLAECVFA